MNIIGTDANGGAELGNYNGVAILNASNNTIGGADPTERNIISGNLLEGVSIGVSITVDRQR